MKHGAPKLRQNAPQQVAFFVFDGYQPLDVAGPWQALCTANAELGFEAYRPAVVSFSAAPRSADGWLRLHAEHLLPDTAELTYDLVIVPGGEGVHEAKRDARTLDWLAGADRHSRRTCGVCTGAFLLAYTGMLDGRVATTHWRSAERLRKERPQVKIDSDRIFSESGKYWTSAGVTAGIDLTLALIERDFSIDLAQRVARRLVVYLRRSGGQLQYSEPLSLQQRASAPFLDLIDRLEADLRAEWTVDDMAQLANMSRRTFQRRVREHLGVSPSELLRKLREERRQTLDVATLSRKEVLRCVGPAGRKPRVATGRA